MSGNDYLMMTILICVLLVILINVSPLLSAF